MDLFCCDKCGTVDAVELAYPSGTLEEGKPRSEWLCSQCLTGEWHGFFDAEKYRPGFDIVINRPNDIGL